MFAATDAVVVREVGLRDGLQSIERILPTAQKIEWIRDAHAAGQREIEVGSFVPARLLPQLADTAELVAFARTCRACSCRSSSPISRALHGTRVGRGPDAGSAVGKPRAQPRQPAKSPDDVVAEIARIPPCEISGFAHLIEVGISTAFGCTIQGRVEPPKCCASCRRRSTRAPIASASPTPSVTPIR